MRVTSLSLLYAAIWLIPTAFALAAHPSSLGPRADTTPEYPKGYDAKTCPLNSKTMTLHALPAMPGPVTQPVAKPRIPTSSMTQRDLTPDDLSQMCRQVGRFPFTQAQGSFLQVETSIVQPGLYVVSVKANMLLGALYVDDIPDDGLPNNDPALVDNNHLNHIGVQISVLIPVRLRITLRSWWPNASGEIALFKIGPRNYAGPTT